MSALTLATYRNVFSTQAVSKSLEQLPASASDSHKSLLENMLASGPERFCMKPTTASEFDPLFDQMPNFASALNEIKAQVALAARAADDLEIMPLLLLGDPGVGKTHFAKNVANALATGFTFVPMSQMTAGWILSGASSQWKSAKPGKVFESIVKGKYANPVILVDEIDKANSDGQYDPLGSLYSLLERDTAKEFIDEFAEIPIDASLVVWICTANDEHAIPKPLLSRMAVFEINAPTLAEARSMAMRMYQQVRIDKAWGAQFEAQPSDEVLDLLSKLSPRVMKLTIHRAFGAAGLDNRYKILAKDVETASHAAKLSMGFI